MIYRTIGSAQSSISAIGFGAAYHNPQLGGYDCLAAAVKAALDSGINFIDTAPVYGDGESEEIVGDVLGAFSRSDVFLASKISPNSTKFSDVITSVEASLKRLKTDVLDLCQIHWRSTETPIEETMGALEKLVGEGKIINIGICNFSLDETIEAMAALRRIPLSSLQCEYNFFERSCEDKVLPFCRDNNLIFIAYSPLAQGNLANGNQQQECLKEMAEKYNCTSAQVVLQWLVSHDSVVAIPNTSKAHRAVENGGATNILLSQEDINLLNTSIITPLRLIDTKSIHPSNDYNRTVYSSVEEAVDNKLNLFPSPSSLAEEMLDGSFLKPIRLKEVSRKNPEKKYDLIEGRLRYWAWIIAHGWNKPIPSLVWTTE